MIQKDRLECLKGKSDLRVHSTGVTSASEQDSEIMKDCVQGAEKVVHGDQAYVGTERQGQAESDEVKWRVLRKAHRRRLSCADRSFNTRSNRLRARVEHALGVHPLRVIKHLWGYRRVRYGGLAGNAAQIITFDRIVWHQEGQKVWNSHRHREDPKN